MSCRSQRHRQSEIRQTNELTFCTHCTVRSLHMVGPTAFEWHLARMMMCIKTTCLFRCWTTTPATSLCIVWDMTLYRIQGTVHGRTFLDIAVILILSWDSLLGYNRTNLKLLRRLGVVTSTKMPDAGAEGLLIVTCCQNGCLTVLSWVSCRKCNTVVWKTKSSLCIRRCWRKIYYCEENRASKYMCPNGCSWEWPNDLKPGLIGKQDVNALLILTMKRRGSWLFNRTDCPKERRSIITVVKISAVPKHWGNNVTWTCSTFSKNFKYQKM